MLLTVGQFQNRIHDDLVGLVEELAKLTGSSGDSELHAWKRSLPRLADVLASSDLDEVHIHFVKRDHHVTLEYQLPGTSSRCDVVLLGRHDERASAVVIELKDWDTRGDRPGLAEGLVERGGMQELHPSDQVRGYVEYCRRFHSAVNACDARVNGFVLLTNGMMKHPYSARPNETLAANYPIFSMAREDVANEIPAYFRQHLTQCDEQFAQAFVAGTYQQNRGLMRQVGKALLDGGAPQFELLDNQRRAFNLCLAKVRDSITASADQKHVLIVRGPPGSGKSAVAAQLWARLVFDPQTPDGNVVLVTTSQSQSSNWTYLIDLVALVHAGKGIARKATSFSPIDTPKLSALRTKRKDPNLYKDASLWQTHLEDFAQHGYPLRKGAEDDSHLVSLVDEAHALINPARKHGVGQYGFVTGLGPQAYHLIRCSRITVFFLDPEQGFRARENTTLEDVKSWASMLGAKVDEVSLDGVQFRCAGSAEYVSWVDSLLSARSTADANRVYASAWYRGEGRQLQSASGALVGNVVAFPVRGHPAIDVADQAVAQGHAPYQVAPRHRYRSTMDFRIFDDLFSMESALRLLQREHSVRLLSTYSRPWKTKASLFPHQEPKEAQDFCFNVRLPGGLTRMWSRPWNFVPKNDYTGFVTGRPGTPIHQDPLCEVGCTYAVRGFDFDYVGLLWLNDLIWRTDGWVVPLENVHESGIKPLVQQAGKEGALAPAGPNGIEVARKVAQAYRILLTRAIKGIFVWIEDSETRAYVERSLGRL